MPQKEQQILAQVKHMVLEAEPTAQVVLFGSRARGDAHADSDWDIMVIVDSPKVSDQQFEKLNYNIWLKGLEMGQEINPVIYTRERWETKVPSLFLHNVKKEGIVL